MQKILAVRGGQKKEFTQTAWNLLPQGKCGWLVSVKKPKHGDELPDQKQKNPNRKGGDTRRSETAGGDGQYEEVDDSGDDGGDTEAG